MVECNVHLDAVFSSLADATRREILKRVSKKELSISELASPYKEQLSFAAIAKHVRVLENAQLIKKRREGKQQIIQIEPRAVGIALTHLSEYQKMWNNRFTVLDTLLKKQ